MKIVVNDIAASSGGALTVLKEFYNCVKENDHENTWVFLLGDKLLEDTENIKIITMPEIKNSRIKKLKFDLFSGKKFINSLNPDVVFSLQNIITFGVKFPQIVYLHQSIPFQKIKNFSFLNKKERNIAVYQHLIGRIIKCSAKKANKVIVQTKWMKKAVCEQCKISESKVINVKPNVNDINPLKFSDNWDKFNFFYPTSNEIYKNNDAVFTASNLLAKKGIKHKVTLTLPKEMSDRNIDCIDRIPYEQVLENYRNSTLIFPSYIETFGYPLAEARAMGTIVLASDCPFSRELLENYENAYFFNPFNSQELSELMEKVISGEIVRKNVENKNQDKENSWIKVMEQVTSFKIDCLILGGK